MWLCVFGAIPGLCFVGGNRMHQISRTGDDVVPARGLVPDRTVQLSPGSGKGTRLGRACEGPWCGHQPVGQVWLRQAKCLGGPGRSLPLGISSWRAPGPQVWQCTFACCQCSNTAWHLPPASATSRGHMSPEEGGGSIFTRHDQIPQPTRWHTV